MSAVETGPGESFGLRRGATPVVLEEQGFHHPALPRGRGHAFSRYADVTHVAATPRALWVGTRRAVYPLARALFVDPAGPERLGEALLARVAREPGGPARLAQMRELDRMAREPRRPFATWTLAAVCLAVFALQLGLGQDFFEVGYFSPALFADGDLWRIATAGLLHGFPLHLAVNLVGLLFFGWLVERALGAPRTLCAMGAAELGSMAASAVADDGGVVGISGVVSGLVGALLYLELRLRDQVPAWWRLPRRLFVLLIVLVPLQALLDAAVPVIAAEAHLGGFVAGLAAAALLGRGEPLSASAGPRVRAAAAAVVLLSLASVGAAAAALYGPGDFRAEHAARIARLPGVSPQELNNHAWLIAIAPDSTGAQLASALRLAERAVAETGRRDATTLDTLAEVQFQLGRRDLALSTIDEAIDRAPPGEPYYREQRRRFTGERAFDDRPPDPALPGPEDAEEPGRPPLPPDDEGIRV